MPNDTRLNRSSEVSQAQPTPEPTLYIDRIIEPQFKDAIFHDPNFFKNFLPFVPSPGHVIGLCLGYDWYLRAHHEWEYPTVINGEQCLHQPILHLLNTIKLATDVVRSSIPVLDIHTVPDFVDTHPPTYKQYYASAKSDTRDPALTSKDVEYFTDWSSRDLAYTVPRAVMHQLRPDIILFQGKQRHWSNIRFIVEIKEHLAYLPAGIKQLARYAHAVFEHQPSRRHFYSLLICGKKAIFVRFDHAGILYARSVDVTRNPAFATALASLLSLDEADQGLAPAFKYRGDGNYIDLPEYMLGKDNCVILRDGSGVRAASAPMTTRRFRILQRSWNPTSRRRVNGPGTFTFHIREHSTLEHDADGLEVNVERRRETRSSGSDESAPSPAEFTLKLSWRLDNDKPEGKALEEAEGIFGVPQHVSHGDIVMPGKCKCVLPLGGPGPQTQCTACVDRTAIVDGLQVLSKFRDLSVNIPLESGDGVSLEPVDLGEFHPAPNPVRINRVYSYILSSSFGKPIEQAETAEIYVTAMMDAILGYWGLYNLGIVHCQITPFNLLVSTKEQKFTRMRWEEPHHEIKDPVLVESERQLREILKEIQGVGPVGMLIDLSAHERLGPTAPPPAPAPDKNKRKRTRKRKGNLDDSIATKPSVATKGYYVRRPRTIGDGPQCPLGYVSERNGIFSSTRVARAILTPEQPYRHHFYDDLESFFWVILWTVIAHVDPGKTRNEHAMKFLDEFRLTDTGSSHIDWKESTLEDCRLSSGKVTLARLAACDNQWASSRLIHCVIVDVGGYIASLRQQEQEVVHPPGDTFLVIIRFIKDILRVNA